MAFWDFFSGSAILVALLIISIWVIIEIRRFRHKIFAIFLIIMILVLYAGTITVFNDKEIDLTSFSGIMDATKLYFSWLTSIFGNLKTIASNVVRLDWSQNFTTMNDNI